MPLTPVNALNLVMDDMVANTRLSAFKTLANLAASNRIFTKTDTRINWDVDLGGGGAGIGLMTADTTLTAEDNVKPAQLTIGTSRIFSRFDLSRVTMQEAATVAPAELSNLFRATLERNLITVLRQLNTLIYTGTGNAASAGVVGLAAVAGTGAYAGIDPAVDTAWSAIRLLNAGTPRALTRNLMLDVDELVSNLESYYDMVITSPAIAKAYVKIFDTLGGNLSLPLQPDGMGGLKRADLGHAGRFYNGLPLVEDTQCTAGSIYCLKMADVSLHCFELSNSPDPAISDIAINRASGVPIHIAELPSSNSATRRFEMYVIPQLQIFNRKSLVLLGDLT